MDPTLLEPREWARRSASHEARVSAWLAPHRERARRGEAHPVEDFLFTYYSYRPAQLRRWHPGAGIALGGDPPHRRWSGYVSSSAGVSVDLTPLRGRRADALRHIDRLLRATAGRAPSFGCFGLHEWAMVYRQEPSEVRHADHPLRFDRQTVAAVVESLPLRCTHFDAFRFFTPAARPRNALTPTRAETSALEQGGCLHTNMDLYKWAYKLSPFTPSELVADCFALAREIRTLDMRASPYDLAALGYPPVRVEEPAGRAEYIQSQQAFAERAAVLRSRLLDLTGTLLELSAVTRR